MWASNDQDPRWLKAARAYGVQPVDQVEVYTAARQMQAEQFAKVFAKLGQGLKALFGAIAAPYKVWREYQETYQELAQLDDRMLADIGITRSDIPRVAAGLWAPAERMERLVKIGVTAKPQSANVNRPQVAA